jgi:hypothetical protein
VNYAGFKFFIEDVWRETLALRPMNGADRGGNGVINMSVSVLSGNFGIKIIFIPKLGDMC